MPLTTCQYCNISMLVYLNMPASQHDADDDDAEVYLNVLSMNACFKPVAILCDGGFALSHY